MTSMDAGKGSRMGGNGRGARRGVVSLGAVVLAGMALGGLGAGCGGEDSTTGKRLTHETVVTAGAEATGGFTNAMGWRVTLSRADVAVGALYYFDGAPVTAMRGRRLRLLDRVSGWLIREAHAHPGHYEPGNALGEMTAATSVDLMGGPVSVGASEAVTGVYRSASFDFGAKAVGPLAGAMGEAVVVVEGVAEKEGMSRSFRAEAKADEVLDTDALPVVEGCVFEEAEVQGDGTVTVLVKPSVWLDQVDFEEVPESADGEPVAFDVRGTPHKAFIRGLKKGTGYVFSYGAGSEEK
ncbi:hypothetical protein [Chondromyces apiculatus]|uniref:Putative lipoprotein n=1 Tax=Chondromyces apiculatus DSM 436 TaxID=1192034 RepID=A0A017T1W5_9BACT|nr:hypothetical protein [Chondromyces apiculatus]EYF03223.1 putative lipoprotein [Chondromyces apiculatus DSM 436]